MWREGSTIGLLIIFFFMSFQLPSASAADTTSTTAKNGKKKGAVVRKAVSSKKKSTARRTSRPAARGKRHAAKAPLRAKAKKSLVRKTKSSSRARKSSNATKKKIAYRRAKRAPVVAAPVLSAGDMAGLSRTSDPLGLRSNVAFVIDQSTSKVLFEKNADIALPIASLTKLMTGLVVVESRQDMQELLEVTTEDIDRIKNTSSRLPIGASLSRADMLHIALMSSENRAASALGRNFPGGMPAFVTAMNEKAKSLGMTDTRFVEPTGLSSENVSSASDLAKLVEAASRQDLLRYYSTYDRHSVEFDGKELDYKNSNRLIGKDGWDIVLQKTGYIREAGRCLLMQLNLGDKLVTMIFLDSKGIHSRFADARQMLSWVEEKLASKDTALARIDGGEDQDQP